MANHFKKSAEPKTPAQEAKAAKEDRYWAAVAASQKAEFRLDPAFTPSN